MVTVRSGASRGLGAPPNPPQMLSSTSWSDVSARAQREHVVLELVGDHRVARLVGSDAATTRQQTPRTKVAARRRTNREGGGRPTPNERVWKGSKKQINLQKKNT